MNAVNIGVIGIGNIGFAHAACIHRGDIHGMRLAAVCDIDSSRRDAAIQAFPGVPVYSDCVALLKQSNIGAVIVAVPHPLHADIAIHAFASGKHVLVEKPVDITVSKAQRLNDAARESGKKFAIMFNQRTGCLFRKAKEIVESGELGTLKRSIWIVTNWYRTQHYYDSGAWRATWQGEGGGVLMNQAPHQLDLWQWICGMPECVTAFCSEGKYHNVQVEDEATLHVRFPGGAEGVFITSTGEFPGTNRLEISGTKGKIVLESGILKWWKLEHDERTVCTTSDNSFEKIPLNYQEFTQPKEASGHQGILQNFADAILHDTPLIAPGYDGIRSLYIQNAAYLSSWKGNVPIQVPFNEKEFDTMLTKKQQTSIPGSAISHKTANTVYDERWKITW